MKAISTLEAQPDKMSERMRVIALMDISGYTGNSIARSTGMTASRISTIRNSPLYMENREKARESLRAKVIDKRSDSIASGDPVELKLKELAKESVGVYGKLLKSDNEGIKKSTADSVLDRAGYKSYSEKTKMTVEVTENMAERFEKALKYDPKKTKEEASNAKSESHENDRRAKIRLEKEVS